MTETGEKFDRINAIPAYQLVADAIEREILARRIRPGEPIGTEAQLVKQFGVNRSTVREGIRLLEQSGLIHRDSGRRLTASLPHYSRLATRMSRAMLLHEVTFRELWEATTALEIATVEQAAAHATADVIAELQANVASTEQASADPAAVAELDTQFHSLIAKASQNRVLQLAACRALFKRIARSSMRSAGTTRKQAGCGCSATPTTGGEVSSAPARMSISRSTAST